MESVDQRDKNQTSETRQTGIETAESYVGLVRLNRGERSMGQSSQVFSVTKYRKREEYGE